VRGWEMWESREGCVWNESYISTLGGVVSFTGIQRMMLRDLERVPMRAVGTVLSVGGSRTLSSWLPPT